MIVTTEDNRIFTQWAGQKRVELYPESSTKFFTKLIDSQRTFLISDAGKATQVIVHQSGRDRVANRIH
ncbi:hypothetical protein CAL7716_081860 [Calothrix sp. PCC 7716]|nr:hypothetical protein CAL7716_081860 [Calothrix sp. PCC 7716]